MVASELKAVNLILFGNIVWSKFLLYFSKAPIMNCGVATNNNWLALSWGN